MIPSKEQLESEAGKSLTEENYAYILRVINSRLEVGFPVGLEADPRHGWIYFFASGDKIKIGYSKNVRRRLSVLSSSSPTDGECIGLLFGGRAFEAAIHDHFAGYHVKGEWFRRTPDLESFARRYTDQIDLILMQMEISR